MDIIRHRVFFGVFLALCVISFLAMAGCGKKTVESDPMDKQTVDRPGQDGGPDGDDGSGAPVSGPGAVGESGLGEGPGDHPGGAGGDASSMTPPTSEQMREVQSELSDATIYFEFDKFDLKPGARETLKKKTPVLKANPNVRVLIEGHCDERGTAEYNLALGERRARATQEFLILLGVRPSQIEIVSYGEEYPAAKGHSEAAWAKNRRCEFKVVR